MTANLGLIDRAVRLVIGAVFVAYALRFGFHDTGWNWVGWVGVVPIVTALFGVCPAYRVIGLSTCPMRSQG